MEQRKQDPNANLQQPYSSLWKKGSNANQKSFIDDAADSAAPYLAAMRNHPFMQELIAGTLDINKAKFYTAQLAYYLENISMALSTIAARDKNVVRSFLGFGSFVITLQADFAGFYQGEKPLPSSVEKLYTYYMRLTAHEAQVEVSVATLLPSCWMHLELVEYLRQQTISPNNPYKPWIDMFCNPDFDPVAQQAIDFTNQIAKKVTPDQRNEMLANFLSSSELELNLLDSSYNLQAKLCDEKTFRNTSPLHVVKM